MPKQKKDWLGLDSLAYMMRFLEGHQLAFWLSILMTASYAFLQNIFTGQLYKVVTTLGQSSSVFIAELLRVLVLLIFIVVVAGCGVWSFTRTTANADKLLRSRLAYKMSRMPMQSWYGRHSGQWLTVLGKDAENAANAYKKQILRFSSLVIESVGGMIVLCISMPYMALYALVSGLLYFGIGLLRRKSNKKFAEGNQQSTATAASYISDILNGFIVMRIYHLLRYLLGKQRDAVEEGYRFGKQSARVTILNGALGQVGYTLAYSGAFIVGLLLVYAGKMELSTMMALWPVSMGVSFSIMQFGFVITDMQPTVVAVERIKTVFALPEETGGTLETVPEDKTVAEFKNVSFSYEKGRTVLDDINLTIRRGEKIAFVGESGSGKSTLVKLLLRFYDPQQGEIRMGGKDIRGYTLEALRGQFAYVPQNAHLLSGTVYQNIAMVKEGATQQQVIAAAENAYADEFIRELPQGYQTQTGERGAQLSGGQRQRIAIARAFLKDAPIFIFDEITAALDGESEAKVQQAVDRTPEGKTLLMITHRLSTAVSADRIVVMENGKIVETGSHVQLLEKGKIYARLWNMQFQK